MFLLKKEKNIGLKQLDIERIKHYKDFISIFDFFCQKAYDLIYKEKILIFSIEGMAVSDAEIDELTKSYVSLVFSFLGPNLKSSLIDFFGDESSLSFNIIMKFHEFYDDDMIRKTQVDSMMDSMDNNPTLNFGDLNSDGKSN